MTKGTAATRGMRLTASLVGLILMMGCAAAPAPTLAPPPAQLPVSPSPAAVIPTPAAEPSPATDPATPTATQSPESAPVLSPPASPSPAPPTDAPASPTVAASPGARVPVEWGEEVRVLEGAYSEPSLVVDADGHAHIAAVRDAAIVHLTNRSGTWSEEQLSTPPGTGLQQQADGQPSIALDGDGTLAVAFTRWGPDDTFGRLPLGVYYTDSRSGSWAPPELLIGDANGAHSPSLELRDGRLHVAYVLGVGVDIVSADMSFPIYYGTAADGEAWSAVEVSPNGTEPVLELSSEGIPHILFGDDYGLVDADALWMAVGSDDGTFELREIANTSRYARPYDFVLDGSGGVQVVWSRPGWASADDRWAAYHQTGNGSWGEPALLMLDGTVRRAAMAPDGTVHVIGSHLEGVWYGSGREGIFETSRLSEDVELWSDVAVDDDGRPHAIWAVGGGGIDELWYRGPAD